MSLTGESLLAVMHPRITPVDSVAQGPPSAPLHTTQYAQPALFALEWSLAQL